MSRTLALALAGTTVASMVPTVPVNAKESAATGTTYYVDSKDGKDSNAGTAENKAFQTLKKVNELNLEPGDTVLLKRDLYLRIRLLSSQKRTAVLQKHR